MGGHARTCKRTTAETRFWMKIEKRSEGCWGWTGALQRDGYAHVNIGGKTISAHRYAYEKLVGPIPDGMDLLHSCDNRACTNPAHLRPGTHQENMRECREKKRHAYGERNRKAKLTEAQVIEIRRLRGEGLKLRELAERFPISETVVQQICSGRKWRHLL